MHQIHRTYNFKMLRSLSLWIFSLFLHRLDNLLSLFVSTTEELQRPLHRLFYCLLLFPLYLTIVIVLLPVGTVGLILWVMVSNNCKTLRYSYVNNHGDAQSKDINISDKIQFNIATVNSCLHSEFISRLNNLSRGFLRAKRIGDILSGISRTPDNFSLDEEIDPNVTKSEDIVRKVLHFQRTVNFIEIPDYISVETKSFADESHSSAFTRPCDVYGMMNNDILCQFLELDFVLLQEVFDASAANMLIKSLHRRFPYVIYDARQDGLSSNFWSLGSGLLIASRFPITHANFDIFKHKDGFATVTSLGVLQARIELGRNREGKKLFGYLTNTHLQPYQGDSPIHWGQLLQIRAACSTFKTVTTNPDDLILFDIVGGDFNLDNMSPVDQLERTHPIFEEFVDVCREAPGCDKPWTVGSEMRHPPLHDSLVQTPNGLRYALLKPELRTRYVIDADVLKATLDLPKQMPPVDKLGQVYVTNKSGKRRVDYLLYNKDYPLVVSAYNAVTELAGLTDHIPFSINFLPAPAP